MPIDRRQTKIDFAVPDSDPPKNGCNATPSMTLPSPAPVRACQSLPLASFLQEDRTLSRIEPAPKVKPHLSKDMGDKPFQPIFVRANAHSDYKGARRQRATEWAGPASRSGNPALLGYSK